MNTVLVAPTSAPYVREEGFKPFEYTKCISLQYLNWRNVSLASLLAALKDAPSPVRLATNLAFFFFHSNCAMCLDKRWQWKIGVCCTLLSYH